MQERSQDFLKGGIELPEAVVWGRSPQPLRDFQYFNESKLSKLLYLCKKYINYNAYKCPWYEASTR